MSRKPTFKLKAQMPTEKQDQIKLCTWLRKNSIFFYHIPNGGSRNYYEAISLNRQGLLKGVPDLCIPIPSKGKHSLYIELKRTGGSGMVSEEQKAVIERLNAFGHKAMVCYGFEEAKKAVEDYLSHVPRGTCDTKNEQLAPCA